MKRIIACGVWIIFAMMLLIIADLKYARAQTPEAAPDFAMEDLQGVNHRLSDYRGQVVVINFWASWCAECIVELPSLGALFDKYKGRGLMVLGITTDRKRESVEPLLKQSRVRYPVLLNTAGSALLKQYRIIGLPSTVVIDKNGFIVERSAGRMDFDSSAFTGKINRLLDSAKRK